MSDFSGMRRFRALDYGNGFQLTAVVIVIAGVALLAVAAFLVSYTGTRAIAVAGGVSPALAGLYPLIIDAVLVVACVAALALRGAEWWMQTYAWLSVMFMLALVALAGAVHAAGVSLPHRPTAAIVAVMPWVLFLLGFGLWLSILRHLRTARAEGTSARPHTASWWPFTADPDGAGGASPPAQPKPVPDSPDAAQGVPGSSPEPRATVPGA
jgi:amino acid transporter